LFAIKCDNKAVSYYRFWVNSGINSAISTTYKDRVTLRRYFPTTRPTISIFMSGGCTECRRPPANRSNSSVEDDDGLVPQPVDGALSAGIFDAPRFLGRDRVRCQGSGVEMHYRSSEINALRGPSHS
jgi:hypothetical protein